MNELLPCPFCGAGIDNTDPVPFPLNRAGTEWVARCGNPACGAEILAPTAQQAAQCWNKRTPVQQVGAGDYSLEFWMYPEKRHGDRHE